MFTFLTDIVGYITHFFEFLSPSRSLLFGWMNTLPNFLVPYCTAFVLFLCLGLIIKFLVEVVT